MKTRRNKMEKITVADWDLAEVLETKDDIIASLEVALAEKDTEGIRIMFLRLLIQLDFF
jgi:DNA-binding phage protein